jgi:snRNA-activating protein complex subunit 3
MVFPCRRLICGCRYLLQHLQISTKKKPQPEIMRAATSMKDTKLSSLAVRVGEPYWLVHRGNCEHFCVVDQIRYGQLFRFVKGMHAYWFRRRAHPLDPTSGFPVTVQVTPPILDLCRACAKVPATWSIVGDSRLGESPCTLCGPCWRSMGEPENSDGILALPLPSYSTL